MGRKRLLALAGAGALAASLGACSGAVHRLPQLSSDDLSMAQGEVAGAGGPPHRHAVGQQDAIAEMRAALQRIRPSAEQVCREMGVGVCTWRFVEKDDRTLNAGATGQGVITVNRGVAEYAENEEQVCMVIAHEIGHQAANHVAAGQRNQAVGALIGGLLLGAAGALASYRSPYGASITRSALQTGGDLGGAIGRISFSKEQEREADYLSALILYRAGVDLDKARGILVIMARGSGRRETGMLDTHPAGPERVAAWDRAVAEIRAADGALPKRK